MVLREFKPKRTEFRILRIKQARKVVQPDWLDAVRERAESILVRRMREDNLPRKEAIEMMVKEKIVPMQIFSLRTGREIAIGYNYANGKLYWAVSTGEHIKLHQKFLTRYVKRAIGMTKASPEQIRQRVTGLDRFESTKKPRSMAKQVKKISREEKKLRFFIDQGLSQTQIGKRLEITQPAVQKKLKKYGLKTLTETKMSEAQMKEAMDLRKQGWTLKKLANRYGISENAMFWRLKRRGLQIGQKKKVTDAEITEAIRLRRKEKWTFARLAEKYGVAETVILKRIKMQLKKMRKQQKGT